MVYNKQEVSHQPDLTCDYIWYFLKFHLKTIVIQSCEVLDFSSMGLLSMANFDNTPWKI